MSQASEQVERDEETGAVSGVRRVAGTPDPGERKRAAERRKLVEAIFERTRNSPWARRAARELRESDPLVGNVASFLRGEVRTKHVVRVKRERKIDITREGILAAKAETAGTHTAVAKKLGVSRRTLLDRLVLYGLVDQFPQRPKRTP